MRLSDLRQKEVVNICDCMRLGCVEDVVIDICKGCIEKIIVPMEGKCYGFLPPEFEYIICWDQIEQIGPDIILVKVNTEEVRFPCVKKKERKKLNFS